MILIKLLLNFCMYFYLGIKTVLTLIPNIIIKLLTKKKKRIIIKRKQKIQDTIILTLTLSVYLICVFLISRWAVQKLKINYLAKSIIDSTEIVEKAESNIIQEPQNIIEPVQPGAPEQPTQPQQPTQYYPNEYWKYTNIKFIDVNLDELKKKNPDTVGWLKINNTNVNYPVTQAKDNKYYLEHSFDKSKNINGWIYGDYRNNFDEFKANSIIYGHNLTNKSMFGSLTKASKKEWYSNQENLNIRLSTTKSNTIWQIFSIYFVDVESYYLRTIFASREDHQTFIDTIASRSINNFNNKPTINDKILTLSTCDDSGTKRFVIHAKMINIEYK